jgi:hypothetical protein
MIQCPDDPMSDLLRALCVLCGKKVLVLNQAKLIEFSQFLLHEAIAN